MQTINNYSQDDMQKGFETLSNALEGALDLFYPKLNFSPSSNAPNDWETLKEYKNSLNGEYVLPVFDGASDSTIYTTKEHNFIFRAWHDAIHLQYDHDFSLEGELAAGAQQASQLKMFFICENVDAGLKKELDKYQCIALQALQAETKGQVSYFMKRGHFPVNQKAFIEACLKHGIDNTIKSKVNF